MRLLNCLLPLCLLLAGGPALAQQLPAPAEASVSLPAPAPAAAPDTAAAIHRLFIYKRHQRTGLLIATLGAGSLLFYAGTQAYSFNTGAALAGVGVLAVPASLAEVALYSRYGPHHEEKVIASFRAHHSPRWLRRKLKDYYFAAPASGR